MTDAIRWEDNTGRVRWQPKADDGRVMVAHPNLDRGDWIWTYSPEGEIPRLCRWRWRALQLARKKDTFEARRFRKVPRD